MIKGEKRKKREIEIHTKAYFSAKNESTLGSMWSLLCKLEVRVKGRRKGRVREMKEREGKGGKGRERKGREGKAEKRGRR